MVRRNPFLQASPFAGKFWSGILKPFARDRVGLENLVWRSFSDNLSA